MRGSGLLCGAWVCVIAGAVGVASAGPAADKKTLQTPTTHKEFKAITDALKAEGQAYDKAGGDKAPPLSDAVKRVQYTAKATAALQKALGTRYGGGLADLYVKHQLLQPLKMADNKTLRPLQGYLVGLLGRCQYKPMPKWPRHMIAALYLPNGLPPDKQLQAMKKMNEIRQKKHRAEQKVAKENAIVNAVEKTVKHLLVLMDHAGADAALVKRLKFEEAKRYGTFHDTLAVIKAEAVRMKQPRAKKLYQALKAIGYSVGVKRNYIDWSAPRYSSSANSGYGSRPAYFGVATLQVVNVLATAAKEPAVKIPDVKKYEEDRRKRARR